MLALLVNLLVILIIVAVAWWILTFLPLPHPLNKIAQVVLVVIAGLAVIYILLGLVDGRPVLPIR